MNKLKRRVKQIVLSDDKDGLFWQVDLSQINLADVDEANAFLNENDRAKASRYHFQKDRHRSTVVYGILKHLISDLIGEPSPSINFTFNDYGKPLLVNDLIHFNLSYTSDYALIGVHRSKPLGVDIEQIDRSIDMMLALDSFLHPEEKQWLLDSFKDPYEGAYVLWCAKESLLKAVGTGFSSSILPHLTPAGSQIPSVHHFKGLHKAINTHEMDVHAYTDVLAHHILSVTIL